MALGSANVAIAQSNSSHHDFPSNKEVLDLVRGDMSLQNAFARSAGMNLGAFGIEIELKNAQVWGCQTVSADNVKCDVQLTWGNNFDDKIKDIYGGTNPFAAFGLLIPTETPSGWQERRFTRENGEWHMK